MGQAPVQPADRTPLYRLLTRRIMVLLRRELGRAARPSRCRRLGGTSLPTQHRPAALALAAPRSEIVEDSNVTAMRRERCSNT